MRRILLMALLVLTGTALAQAIPDVPALCAAARDQAPFLVEDGRGRLYSQLTLQTDFTAQGLRPGLIALRRRLENLGIALVAVPVPWAAMVNASGSLTGSPTGLEYASGQARAHYAAVIGEFRQAGISTVDLLSLFLMHPDEDLYFRTDHHWKLPAVELAARAVAATVPLPFQQRVAAWNSASLPMFEGDFTFQGGFAVTAAEKCGVLYPPEHTFATVKVAEQSADLLGEEVPPVVLFGSSFSRGVTVNTGSNPYALGYGFEQWLSSELRAQIQNESISSGAQTSMLSFFATTGATAGRLLAVWEFPISDFAPERVTHNQTFLAQMEARLSRLAHPNAIPAATARREANGVYSLSSYRPEPTYLRVTFRDATPLTPVITLQGTLGTVTLDLARDGNKVIQAREFVVTVPDGIGAATRITVTFPSSGAQAGILEISSVDVYPLNQGVCSSPLDRAKGCE